jgi:polygalacturonase
MKYTGPFATAIIVFITPFLYAGARAHAQFPESVRTVTSYGAKGDGKTLNTQAVNQAISECSAAGGGTVIVPAGRFVSGPIELLENVTLHLEAGAVIMGSTNLEDYTLEKGRGSGESPRAGLLTARNASHIAITGRGVIEGNGMTFVDAVQLHGGSDYDKKYTRQQEDFMNPKYGTQDGPLEHGERPGNLVRFFDCTNILISGVTIQNSPTWTVQIAQCERVNIAGVAINSFGSDRRVPNDDGMDLVESKYVHVSDCDIQTGDDCIALFGSEKISVANCTLSSRSVAVRVGFTGADIRDCVFANLVIHTSNRGLGVFVRGSGSVENILFSDIVIETRLFTGHWWGKGEPIQVSAIPWDPQVTQIGHIKNVRFRNIIAESESGIIVYGCEQSVIKGLSFQDVKVQIKTSPLQESYGGNFDLRSSRDLATALFAHDIPAFYCQYVDGLKIHGLEVEWADGLPSFFTSGIQCENFNDVDIEGFSGSPAHKDGGKPVIALSKGSTISIRNCKAGKGTGVFLSHSDVVEGGLFVNNDLAEAREVCAPEKLPFQASGNRLPKEPGHKHE